MKINLKNAPILHKDDFDGNIVYGGKSFHKETNRGATMAAVLGSEWGSQFFTNINGELHPKKEYFDTLDKCICCDSVRIEKRISRQGLTVSQCLDCTFGFQNPRIKDKYISEIYDETYVMDSVYTSPIGKRLDRLKFRYGIQKCSLFTKQLESILDVGCGPGESLDAYEELGIPVVYGIDPTDYGKSSRKDPRISRNHINVIPEKFSELSLITLWDTLEHIHDFKRMISSIYSALKKEGLVLIMVPNFLSLATRLMRERSPTFQIDHLNYFSEESLTNELETAGFTLCMKETVISEIDNCRNYLEFQEPYLSAPKNEAAFGWLTAEYIHSHMLGSRLLMIAKK